MSEEDYCKEYKKVADKYGLKEPEKYSKAFFKHMGTNKALGGLSHFSFYIGYSSNQSAIANVVRNVVNNISNTIHYFANKNSSYISSNNISHKEEYKKDTLVDVLLRNPFSILANGELYKKGRAGSDSYTPLTPYEPYKYILNNNIAHNEYDDILEGRTHFKAAGNRDYWSNIGIDLHTLIYVNHKRIKARYDSYLDRNKKVVSGYKELNDLGFYTGDVNYGFNPFFIRDESGFIKDPVVEIKSFKYFYDKEMKNIAKPIFNNFKYKGYFNPSVD